MQRTTSNFVRLCSRVFAVAALTVLPVDSAVADKQVDVSQYTSASDALGHGESLEGKRDWVGAIRFYEAAIEKFEEEAQDSYTAYKPAEKPAGLEDLKYALRRTRVHFAIERRYSDNSFEKRMLLQSQSEALDLMEDVMTRVQLEYVDSVSAKKFVAHGTESFYMALGNDRFIKAHIRGDQRDGIDRVRKTLIREYWNKRISSRLEARMVISDVCDLARRELNLPATAVVMEYLFGGCNALDEYSNFLTPDRYSDLFGSIKGEFVGIGIEMEAEKGRGMHLVNVLLDSPAEEGGLRPGDFIVGVDGHDCRNLTTDDAARLLRGTRGSRVKVSYESLNGKVYDTQLVRRPVKIRSVTRALIIDDQSKVGYIRMTGFQNSTEDEMDRALRELEQQGMKSLIWDLRGNPGGLLDTAAAVIDRFIDDGVLVSTEGRSRDQNQTFRARSYNTRSMPLVLLVDENSASASEIVAGAINDHKRGQIVGRKTYGKWSVQSIIHLPGGTGLKLTTAKFYSPEHQNYAGRGIRPHHNVPLPQDTRSSGFRPRTSDEIRIDPDVARALEILGNRFSQN